ncbi:MAG: phosphatase [Ramlibacter sp.]|jgi:protein-tyrosine phosphatase|uniref:protein-tyrosine phosphatase family protein n=1 Tax=Ramlibacter sp. TaxID=1917967 RepID=UPI0026331CF6|nr:tyrosine-protein phosphatase [Ramlibacter sp.]MDB5753062.1 phosphatase [Ramlibacter sp.]
MTLRSVALPTGIEGRLWLGPMPGRFEPWPQFQSRAQTSALALVVCLTPRSELSELSPQYLAAVDCGRLPFRWLHLPMRNFGSPEDPQAFRRGIGDVAAALRGGDAVLLHCAAGVGRTGTAAACVLKAVGMDVPQALQRVRDAGSNPQNAEQSGLVDWF